MALLDKFKFWKKRDPFDEIADLKKDIGDIGKPEPFKEEESFEHELGTMRSGIGELPEEPKPMTSPLTPTPLQTAGPGISARDVELLSSKLDTIKATMDSINQRLMNLERIAEESQKPKW